MPEEQIVPPQNKEKGGGRNYEKIIANWTVVLAASTIALCLATALSAYFLYKTDRTIETQLETTKLQMRARIIADRNETTLHVEKPSATDVSSADVQIVWKNIGYTPAFDFDWFISIKWYPNGVEPDFSKALANDPSGPPETIGPLLEKKTKGITIYRADILKASAGNGRIFIWGRATYRDFAPDSPERYTAFCYLADFPLKNTEQQRIQRYRSDCNKSN
jgi:hypothetical protein